MSPTPADIAKRSIHVLQREETISPHEVEYQRLKNVANEVRKVYRWFTDAGIDPVQAVELTDIALDRFDNGVRPA